MSVTPAIVNDRFGQLHFGANWSAVRVCNIC